MLTTKLRFVLAMALACLGLYLAQYPGVHAADYPNKTVRVIVPYAPGGGVDISTRILAQKLTQTLGQSFVVDNRPGAGSILGTDLAAKAPADGYTLLVVAPEFTINPSLQPELPFDTIRDFAPIVSLTFGQNFLSVLSTVPASSVKELIALARANPRQLNYGSSGNGSPNHLAGELFKTMAGIDMAHIPYKGSGQSVTALLAGEIQVIFSSATSILPHIKSGRVRVLAVAGRRRTPIAPDVPTVAEAGLPGFEVISWYGLLAPARTPALIINRLNAEVNRALLELKERYAGLGTELAGGTSREFANFIKAEIEKWTNAVRISGAKPD